MEASILINLLEAITIFCFGLSWPVAIRKSYTSRTAKGKSLFFEVFLLLGYAVGIVRKIMQISILGHVSGGGFESFVFYLGFLFYVLNFVEIVIDIVLYFRNVRIDRQAAQY